MNRVMVGLSLMALLEYDMSWTTREFLVVHCLDSTDVSSTQLVSLAIAVGFVTLVPTSARRIGCRGELLETYLHNRRCAHVPSGHGVVVMSVLAQLLDCVWSVLHRLRVTRHNETSSTKYVSNWRLKYRFERFFHIEPSGRVHWTSCQQDHKFFHRQVSHIHLVRGGLE